MKVALVGGGGFRAPIVYGALARAGDSLGVEEVVLHDLSRPRLELIRSVIEGMAAERGGGPRVAVTTALDEAVDGAGFVLCAIRVGGLEGRVIDETAPQSLGVLGQETVGPAGIAFALRTVPVMRAIAETVARLAPRAWFLNFTNPAGLVTESVRQVLGDRVVGICDSPSALCRSVASALDRRADELSFGYLGLNHLGWLTSVRRGRDDLLPALLADDRRLSRLAEARVFGLECLRELGMIPSEYVAYYLFADRIREALDAAGRTRGQFLLEQQSSFYLTPHGSPAQALAAWRRTKGQRDWTYMEEARPAPYDPASADEGPHDGGPEDGGSEESADGYAGVAVACMLALSGNRPSTLIVGTANDGAIPFLDPEAVVEVPRRVDRTGVGPVATAASADLPAPQRALLERVRAAERAALRAAATGSPEDAIRAIALHPVVPSSDVARRIFAAYRDRHPSIRERFA
jgi:6-phospho-beta-glucosidase